MAKKRKEIKKIKIKPKKARKVFANSVSRGNPSRKDLCVSERQQLGNVEDRDSQGSLPLLSPLAQHALTKQIDGTLGLNGGASGLSAARIMKGYGCILRSDYDIQGDEDTTIEEYMAAYAKPIPAIALENAKDYRIVAYERLHDANDIVRSIACTEAGVLLNMQIFKGAYSSQDGLLKMPKFTERACDNHSVNAVGYKDNAKTIIFQNSWGSHWGDGGRGYVDQDYVNKYILESWRLIFDPNLGQEVSNFGVDEYSCKGIVYKSAVNGRQPIETVDVYKAGEIVGWIHFRLDDAANTIIIDDLYMKPDHRNSGLLGELLRNVEEEKKKNHIPRLVGHIHIQDVLNPNDALLIQGVLSERGYSIYKVSKKCGFVYQYEMH